MKVRMRGLDIYQRMWAASRYRLVVVKYRTAVHFGVPGRPFTLCMRRAQRAAIQADGTQVCVVCRQAARVAYEMKVPGNSSARLRDGV